MLFRSIPLTANELQQDCLAYMQYTGKPVKASRLFAGNEHEQETKRLAEHFQKPNDYYKTVKYRFESIEKQSTNYISFAKRNLNDFKNYEEAYHQLISDIIAQQKISTDLVIHNAPVKQLFVDGGFGKNEIYMNLLAKAFPKMEVYAASVAQATALGAALAIHQDWNTQELPLNLIELQRY